MEVSLSFLLAMVASGNKQTKGQNMSATIVKCQFVSREEDCIEQIRIKYQHDPFLLGMALTYAAEAQEADMPIEEIAEYVSQMMS